MGPVERIAFSVAALLSVAQSPAWAQTLTTLHRFNDSGPYSGVVLDTSGVLYGTIGTDAFALAPPASGAGAWTYSILTTKLPGGTDVADLVQAGGQTFLGTNFYGYGGGAFALSPPGTGKTWTSTPLRPPSTGLGGLPDAPLLIGPSGNIYGTTLSGGKAGFGQVFQLTPPSGGKYWNETILYTFKNTTDGAEPRGNLIMDASGDLYGTTTFGGRFGTYVGAGTAYRLSPPPSGKGSWTFTLLHTFTGVDAANDGYPMAGMIMDSSGALYGTTSSNAPSNGCGSVFKLTPPSAETQNWTETILHTFGGKNDGCGPYARLTFDFAGDLFGATELGGAGDCEFGCGTVFELTPPGSMGESWTETVLYRFLDNNHGVMPISDLAIDGNGTLYGTTPQGASSNCPSCGTVFAITR